MAMRKLLCLLMLATLWQPAISFAQVSESAEAAIVNQLKAGTQRWIESFNQHDVTALASLYTDNCDVEYDFKRFLGS